MNKPKLIDISQEELDELIKRVEAGTLLERDREIIKAMAETISLLSQAVDEKSASIRRLLRMIFGSGTEKTADILKNKDKPVAAEKDKSDRPDKAPTKGHGRNGASSYSGADRESRYLTKPLNRKINAPSASRASCMKSKRPIQWFG